MLSPQAALIYAMVVAAGPARGSANPPAGIVGDLAHHLPILDGLDRGQVAALASDCAKEMAGPGGVERIYGQIRAALSDRLREAAYALSCDVIAVSRRRQPDVRALEQIRTRLEVDAATARAIERAAEARVQAA
jgi:hypothetical protein